MSGRPDVDRIFRFLEENERLDPSVLERRCDDLLATQLDYLSTRSVHYRVSLERIPERLSARDRLLQMPLLDKETLLNRFDQIVTDPELRFTQVQAYLRDRETVDRPWPNGDYMVVSTAGTTGKPGYFAYSRAEEAHIRAQYLRFMNAVLSAISFKGALRTSAIIMTGTHMIGHKMMRSLPSEFVQIIPVMQEGQPISVKDMASRLRAFRPHVLTCFGTTLRMLADHKAEFPAFDWSPRAIISTGATLDPEARRRAIAAFPGVKIFDLYGSTDTGYIGWTCERGGMHLNIDCCRVEVLDQSGQPVPPGKQGLIHLTPLWHRTLPVARYRLGDLVSVGSDSCGCGRSLPLLAQLWGRENTLLYRAGLRPEPVSHGAIVELFETTAGVRRFRLVQRSLTELEVEVVPLAREDDPEPELFRRLRAIFGPSAQVQVRRVQDIAPHPVSGKLTPIERLFSLDDGVSP